MKRTMKAVLAVLLLIGLLGIAAAVSADTVPDGLYCVDGIWQLYLGGGYADWYTGLYNDPNLGWWLIGNGNVAHDYTGLWNDPNCGWWLIDHGAIAWNYTGLWNDPYCGWWLIGGGQICWDYTGLWNDPNCGWWLIDHGTIAWNYTGLWNDPNCGWWLIGGGTIAWDYNGFWDDPACGRWMIRNGTIDWDYQEPEVVSHGIWDSRISFPSAAELSGFETSERAPYLVCRPVFPGCNKYVEYAVDFKADYAPNGTYLSICNWDMDLSGLKKYYRNAWGESGGVGAYAGFQVLGDGRHVAIMSIWHTFVEDSAGNVSRISATVTYPQNAGNPFDGEGTGTQCIIPFDWQTGHMYRAVIQQSYSASNTVKLGFWVCDLQSGAWTKLIEYDTHYPELYMSGACSFLECFAPAYAGNVRTMEMSNFRVRSAETFQWVGATSATMEEDFEYPGSYNYGTDGNTFWQITTGLPNRCQAPAQYQKYSVTSCDTGEFYPSSLFLNGMYDWSQFIEKTPEVVSHGVWDDRIDFPSASEISAYQATDGAPCVICWPTFPDCSEYSEYAVDFRAEYLPKGTYLAVCTWDMDVSALKSRYQSVYRDYSGVAAYAGFQVLGDGSHVALMSAWGVYCKDAAGNVRKIAPTVTYPSNGGNAFKDGNGTQCIVPYEWKEGRTYRALIQRGVSDSDTVRLEFWVCDLESGAWTKLVEYDMNVPGGYMTGARAHLEGFMPAYAGAVRTMELSNIRVRSPKTGKWVGAKTAAMYPSGDCPGSYNYGSDENHFWVITTALPDRCRKPETNQKFSVKYCNTDEFY